MKKKYRFCNLLSGHERALSPQNFVNEARSEATIYIYDEISSWWGISAEWFAGQLNSMLDVPVINIRVNSPGGDIFEARAMQAAMAQHPATIVVHIDGLAASSASFLIRGANKRIMSDGAFLMIHQAWSWADGNSQALISRGEALEKIDGSIIDSYMKVTGIEREQIAEWINKETWFTAAEAKEHGFVEEVIEAKPIKNVFDLRAVFENTPDAMVNLAITEPTKEDNREEKIFDFLANSRDLELLELDS